MAFSLKGSNCCMIFIDFPRTFITNCFISQAVAVIVTHSAYFFFAVICKVIFLFSQGKVKYVPIEMLKCFFVQTLDTVENISLALNLVKHQLHLANGIFENKYPQREMI